MPFKATKNKRQFIELKKTESFLGKAIVFCLLA